MNISKYKRCPASFIAILLILKTFLPADVCAQEPYAFSAGTDGYILGLAIPLAVYSYSRDHSVQALTLSEIAALRVQKINRLDRYATSHYSEQAAKLSDVLLISCIASPLALLSSEKIRRDAAVISGLYVQSLLFSTTLTFASKSYFKRIRPYAYHPDTPLQKKLMSETRKSFFSGHTSLAFTSTVFLAVIYQKYYPQSKWEYVLWAGSLLSAGYVGYLRIAAGYHFPTDVIVGAIVGTAIGILIPKWHETSQTAEITHINQSQMRKPIIQLQLLFN